MSNLLKNITNSLLEAEDDLFPGLDSSAFDEHNKIMVKRPQLEELDRVEGQIERLAELQKANDARVSRLLQDMRAQKLFLPNWQTAAGKVRYLDVPGIATNFPAAAKALEGHSYDSTKHPTNTLQPVIAEVDRVYGRREQIKDKLRKLKAKGTRLRKIASGSEIERQQKENPKGGRILDSDIPKNIRVKYFGNEWQKTGPEWVSEDIENPYFDVSAHAMVISTYAGHPAHFNWVKREITQYMMLTNFVKYLGLPELNILYAKRLEVRNTGKEKLQCYMANSDKSFQYTRTMWGANTIYTKDVRIQDYNTSFNINFVIEAKAHISKMEKLMKKSKSKKP